MKCGWCKTGDLKEEDAPSGTPAGDRTLQVHVVPGTASTKCKGPETYRDSDSTGRPAKQ